MRREIAEVSYAPHNGIGVLDPEVIAAVAALLGAIALTACLIPARKAAKVNPAVVLSA